MKKSRYSEEQSIAVVKDDQAAISAKEIYMPASSAAAGAKRGAGRGLN